MNLSFSLFSFFHFLKFFFPTLNFFWEKKFLGHENFLSFFLVSETIIFRSIQETYFLKMSKNFSKFFLFLAEKNFIFRNKFFFFSFRIISNIFKIFRSWKFSKFFLRFRDQKICVSETKKFAFPRSSKISKKWRSFFSFWSTIFCFEKSVFFLRFRPFSTLLKFLGHENFLSFFRVSETNIFHRVRKRCVSETIKNFEIFSKFFWRFLAQHFWPIQETHRFRDHQKFRKIF